MIFDVQINYVDEAVDWVRENCQGATYVGFSGGKDSICTAEIMRLSGLPYELHYKYTGIDPPEMLHFIRKHYPECKIHFPKRTFWRDLSVNVPPSDRLRWCCNLLKKTHDVPRILGIRAEEGTRRAKVPRTNNIKGVPVFYPILNWMEWQVWEFIEDQSLPYPKLYDKGFDRIGCVVCPYHSEVTGTLHQKYRRRWPNHFKAFERAIAKLYWKRVNQGRQMHYPSPEAFLAAWYLDDSSRWYAKDDPQMKLFT